MQLNDRPIARHQHMLRMKLSAVRQDLRKFVKGVRQKIRFGVVMTGKRMGAFNRPINIVGNVREEFSTVTALKRIEDVANFINR